MDDVEPAVIPVPEIIPFATPLYWRRLQITYGFWFYHTFQVRLHAPYWSNITGLDLAACDDSIWCSKDNESLEDAIRAQWGNQAVRFIRRLTGIDQVVMRRDEDPVIIQADTALRIRTNDKER